MSTHPSATYQIVTDEYHDTVHSTYVYPATYLSETQQHITYMLDMNICNYKYALGHNNIVGEIVRFNNRYIHKDFFSLERDPFLCVLTIEKYSYDGPQRYLHQPEYWYPEYNNIIIKPGIYHHHHSDYKNRIQQRRRKLIKRAKNAFQKSRIIKTPRSKPKVVIKSKHRQKHRTRRGMIQHKSKSKKRRR